MSDGFLQKAREWNIDPQRIGLTGGSAGACTALWLALHDDLADPRSPDPIARESTRPTCVAVSAAPTSLDPRQLRAWMANAGYGGNAFGFSREGRSFAQEFDLLLANRETLLPWIREYSPIEHVTPDDPPIFMEYPKEKGQPVIGAVQPDATHSAVHGLKLAEALRAAGVEVVLTYPASPDPHYPTMASFLIAKLRAR
jgi:acetyl esterase/lipase